MRGLNLPVLTLTLAFLFFPTAGVNGQKNAEQSWTAEFPLEKDEISTVGRNPYFTE